MSRYYDDFDEPYYLDDNYRPPLTGRGYGRHLKDARAQFREEVAAITLDLDTLTANGQQRAQQFAESGNTPGPYVAFLTRFNEDETPEQRAHRHLTNQIRHQHTSYDEIHDDAYASYWMPNSYPNDLWLAVMEVIVERWPHLEPAKKRGLEARRAYNKHRREQRRREEEAEYEAFLEMERREKEEKAQYRRDRSRLSAALKPLFHVDQTINVYDKARLYPATITKLNRVTAHVEWAMKNGKVKSKNLYFIYMYADNRDELGHVDDETTSWVKANCRIGTPIKM